MRWTRLKAIFGTAEDMPQQEPTQLDNLVNSCRDKDFAVVHAATGVPRDEHITLVDHKARKIDDASRSQLSPEAVRDTARTEADLAAYQRARGSALVTETVAVGTTNASDLEEVAEHTARSIRSGADPGSRPIRYEVERNPDGTVREFDSLKDAVATMGPDVHVVVTAEEYREHVALPDRPLQGLGRKGRPTNFDVDHTVPNGVPKVKFAEILDNQGNPTGEPLEMTLEHTMILAETESGKSVLLRAIITDKQRQNFDRKQAAEAAGEETYDHEAILVIDCKKEGGFTNTLSKQIGGARTESGDPMPEEMATVHHHSSGGEGPGVRINLLKGASDQTFGWRKRIDTALEVMTAKYKAMDPDTHRTVKKFLGDTLDTACRMFGINPKSGKAMYPHGKPVTPPGEFVAGLTEEVVSLDTKMVGDHKNNVVGWVQGEEESMFRGDNGAPLAAEGYDFNGTAVLENEGVTSIDLKNVTDRGARQVTVLGLLYDMYDACAEKNRLAGTPEGTDKILATVIIDEADVFGVDALGEALADFFTHARSQGMRIIFAKQGDSEGSIHKQVRINTPNKIMLRSGYAPDLVDFADHAGRTTFEDMQHLAGAPKGDLVYKGPEMERAVRGRVPNPHDPDQTPMADQSYVRGPEAFIDRGPGVEVYDRDLMAEVRATLAEEPFGADISDWAEDSIMCIASGRGMDDIGGQLRAALTAGLHDPNNPQERTKMRCLITEAAKNSVYSRTELQYKAPLDDYAEHLVKHMLALADGEPLPDWDKPRPDLALDAATYNKNYNPRANPDDDNSWKKYEVAIDGKFGAAKDRLSEQMTATKHPATELFEDAIGHRLKGETATEQRDQVVRYTREDLNRLQKVLKDTADGRPVPVNTLNLTRGGIAAIVGGKNHHIAQVDGAYSGELTPEQVEAIRTSTYEGLVAGLTKQFEVEPQESQLTALKQLIVSVPVQALVRPVGYDTVLNALDDRIEHQKDHAVPVPADELRELCGEEIPGSTAKEQFRRIERELEQTHLATVSYATKLNTNRIFFSMGMLRPGSLLDNNLDVLQRASSLDGPIVRAVNMRSGLPAVADRTLGRQLADGNHSSWKDALAEHFIYSDNFRRSPAKARYLLLSIGSVVSELHIKTKEASAANAAKMTLPSQATPAPAKPVTQ
jgi:hypothetical protein